MYSAYLTSNVFHTPLAAFASLAAKLLTNQTESEQLLRAFAVFDRDRRGTIPVREFRRILSEIGDTPMKPAELLDALIEFADPQGTGQVRRLFALNEPSLRITNLLSQMSLTPPFFFFLKC